MVGEDSLKVKASFTMLGESPRNVIAVRLLQLRNAPQPMLSTLSGIVMLVMLLQSTKEYSPMLVTLSGIVTFVSLLQSLKASLWILATDLPSIVLGIINDPDAFL
jgi:hypothetical protein